MIFANLVGDKGVGRFNRLKKKGVVPFVNNVSELYEDARVVFRNNVLQVVSVSDGIESEDIFMKDLVGTGNYQESTKCGMTIEQLADTEENPLIAVMSEGVRFYEGIPTLIKYIHIEQGMFVLCLIYGACEFLCSDGTFIPMVRNINTDTDERATTSVYTDSKLKEIASTVDKESDYDMAYDIVNAVLIDAKNEFVCKYKTVRDAEYILSTVGRDARRAVLAKKKAEAEAKAEARRESNRRFMEERRAKEEREKEEAVKEQFAKPEKVKVTKETVKKREEGSKGAKNFMAALRELGYAK